MKVYFHTLGCRVNQYDTEALRSVFLQLGFEPTRKVAEAQVAIVNTCSVTSESDRKCRSAIRRLRRSNAEAFLVVTGCYASGSPGDLENMSQVDLVMPSRGKDPQEVVAGILEALEIQCPNEGNTSEVVSTLTSFGQRTRAFIKIEDGCNQMCTYCRIPFYRGRARSRSSAEILEEVRNLGRQGYGEVVLCGIQMGAFGCDSGESLPELIRQIDATAEISRFRLSSIEPDDVSDELVETLLTLPKSVPHLHLPLQSGDNGVLERMRRRYTYEQYRSLVERFRKHEPEFAVSTDIMVGFPGEDKVAFENSLRAVKEIEFCRLHIFRFSPRPGTKAASFSDPVPQNIIDQRRDHLGKVAEEVVEQVRRRQVGRTLQVLLEEPGKMPGTVVGFSENYLRVQAQMESQGYSDDSPMGCIAAVRIESLDDDNLLGRIVA